MILNTSIPKNLASWMQGYADELLRRPYNDGINPKHDMQICIPPDVDNLDQLTVAEAYRLGRLVAMNNNN